MLLIMMNSMFHLLLGELVQVNAVDRRLPDAGVIISVRDLGIAVQQFVLTVHP